MRCFGIGKVVLEPEKEPIMRLLALISSSRAIRKPASLTRNDAR